MTHPRMSRFPAAMLLAAAALLAGTPANAAVSSTARFEPQAKTGLTLPAYAKPHSGIVGRLKPGALFQPAIELTLPDGSIVTAHQVHVTRNSRSVTWAGKVSGPGGGELTLTAVAGRISGVLVHRGETYELRPESTSGDTLLFAIDGSRLPNPGPLKPAPISSPRAATPAPQEPPVAAAEVVQDLLVLVTSSARAELGSGADGAIANAVARANNAYRAGGVELTLNLVSVQNSDVTEGADASATLSTLRASASANAAREAARADMVVLVASHTDLCGIAYFMQTASASFAPWAFGVVAAICVPDSTLAHEVGHMQGLSHNREDAGGSGVSSRPYSFGYRRCVADGSAFRDIMSYACTNGVSAPRVSEFSNPRRSYQGHPFGIDYAVDPANSADAARALGDNAGVVAAFRAAPIISPPAAPTGLALSNLVTVPPTIRLSWSDASSDELGFLVERSTDGTSWAEVARVDAGATTHEDRTVSNGVTYSYRVLAYNSAGNSAASNVATITAIQADSTPDAFTFTTRTGVTREAVQVSNAITVGGISVRADVSVTGGEYSIGCTSTFTSTAASVGNGDTVCVRHTSSASYQATVATTLTIGGVSGTFSTTTAEAPPASGSGGGASGGGGGGGAFDWFALLTLAGAAGVRLRRRRN